MRNTDGRSAREAVAVACFATAMTPVLYLVMSLFKMAFLVQWNDLKSLVKLWHLLVFSLWDDILFFPWPSAWLWAAIGIICGSVWLTGAFWCGRFGRWRHDNSGFYDRPENFVRRCRLLGAICGVPSFFAVCAYYLLLLFRPNAPIGSVDIGLAAYIILGQPRSAGPEAELVRSLPRLASVFAIKATATLVFVVAPSAVFAAIGAMCGWSYGRWVRPLIQRLWPAFPGAA